MPSSQVSLSQALVVGVSRYQHVPPLPSSEDVRGVRDVLVDSNVCAYPSERVTVLEEEAATRENILAALDALASQATSPSSRTFLYFSGHGGQGSDGASYFIPVDARKGEFPTTAISGRELAKHLVRCAGEVTVVLDCCYAGGMAGNSATVTEADAPDPLAPFGDAFRQHIQARGRVVFAASRPDAYSYGSLVAPYGIFTGHMIDGLRGKASTDGLDVTVLGLFNYVSRQVVHSSGKVQHPSFIANIETAYALTRYPKPMQPSIVFEKDVLLLYDREDSIQRDWVKRTLQPELERNGCTLWDYDSFGNMVFDMEEAIVKCKYVVVLITPAYLRSRMDELKTTMAIMQAVETRSPRFLPVKREPGQLPYLIKSFEGLDLSDANLMGRKRAMERLIARLKKEPHLR